MTQVESEKKKLKQWILGYRGSAHTFADIVAFFFFYNFFLFYKGSMKVQCVFSETDCLSVLNEERTERKEKCVF